jgi:hypothetical protein
MSEAKVQSTAVRGELDVIQALHRRVSELESLVRELRELVLIVGGQQSAA